MPKYTKIGIHYLDYESTSYAIIHDTNPGREVSYHKQLLCLNYEYTIFSALSEHDTGLLKKLTRDLLGNVS